LDAVATAALLLLPTADCCCLPLPPPPPPLIATKARTRKLPAIPRCSLRGGVNTAQKRVHDARIAQGAVAPWTMFSKLCFFDPSVRGSRRRPAIAASRVTACRFGTASTPAAARTETSAATAAAHALKRPASKTQSGTGARSLRAEGVVMNAARCTLMPLLIPAFAAAIRFRIPAAAILRFTSRKRACLRRCWRRSRKRRAPQLCMCICVGASMLCASAGKSRSSG